MAHVEFFFDIGSPYSYLAATQMHAFEQRTGVKVAWRPFLLGGVFKGSGNNMPGAVAAKASYMLHDLVRWAKLYEVPFEFSTRFPLNTLRTERVLVAVEQAHGQDAMRKAAMALFDRYWVHNEDVSTDDVIVAALGRLGFVGSEFVAAADTPPVKEALRQTTEEAIARGAFGAPMFFVGDAMFFGNDRIVLLEQHVADLAGR